MSSYITVAHIKVRAQKSQVRFDNSNTLARQNKVLVIDYDNLNDYQ